MDLDQQLAEPPNWMPAGEPLATTVKPVLGPKHLARLRKLWRFDRPVCLTELTGLDLDLMVAGYLDNAKSRGGSGLYVAVTRLGLTYLHERRQETLANCKPHHDLASRLSLHLRALGHFTWENIEFAHRASGEPARHVRADVFACLPVLQAKNARSAIYEVKVSRADFLADLGQPEKRGAYAAIADAVYYCCPTGLFAAHEVPEGFGLIVEQPGGRFTIERKARRQRGFQISVDTALTLMVKRQVPISDGD